MAGKARMTRLDAFGQLILARLRQFYREPVALFWVYGFPLLVATILGAAFATGKPIPPTVDVLSEPDSAAAEKIAQTLRDAGLTVEVRSEADCAYRLRTGKTALYIVGPQISYVYDPARADSLLARRWSESVLLRSSAPSSYVGGDQIVTEPGRRYIDFLIPGLIGSNIMGGGLWGLGFNLADMRARKLFVRLMATPVHRGDFLLSFLTSRLLFLIPDMLILLGLVGLLLFKVPLLGSPFALLAAILMGAIAFAGLGLLIGSRAQKTETISGLINLVMMPSWLFSGVFFSSKRFPDSMQPFIQALPLTQLNDAMREVMLDGAGLEKIAWRLGILALWGGVSFFLALRFFRWR